MAAAQYTIRRAVFTLLGAKFHIYDSKDRVIGVSRQKAFKLKEDIRIYSDEGETDERLSIRARSVIDFSATYDVVDGRSQQKLGSLQRRGWQSLTRDAWLVNDENDTQVATIGEDSMFLALVRRFLTDIIPQTFHVRDSENQEIAELKTHFNPFIHRMTVTVHEDCPVDPLLVLAAGVLLMAVEGRQKG